MALIAVILIKYMNKNVNKNKKSSTLGYFLSRTKMNPKFTAFLGLILSGKETGSDFGTGRGIRVGMRISRKN